MVNFSKGKIQMSLWSKAIGIGILAAGILAAGAKAEESELGKARREAEMYAQRSDEYRARPPRAHSAEEAEAKKIMDQAAAILGEADTEAMAAQAVELYRKAAEIAPKDDETWSGLGNALFLQGLFIPLDEAGAKPKKLALYGKARPACTRAANLNPPSPAANLCLANVLLAEGEVKGILASAWVLPEVFKLSDKIAAVDPYYDDGAIFRTFAVVIYAVPAWITRRFGFSPDQILPYLDKAVERAPDRFINYVVRAGIYIKLDQNDRALNDLEFVLSRDPASLKNFQRENRTQQKTARQHWKKFTGKEYPQRK